jgi:hypothetical protein
MSQVTELERKIQMVIKLNNMLFVNTEVEKFGVEKFDFENFTGYMYPENTFKNKEAVYKTRDELLSFIAHNLLVLPAELCLAKSKTNETFNSIDLSSFVSKK